MEALKDVITVNEVVALRWLKTALGQSPVSYLSCCAAVILSTLAGDLRRYEVWISVYDSVCDSVCVCDCLFVSLWAWPWVLLCL